VTETTYTKYLTYYILNIKRYLLDTRKFVIYLILKIN